MDKQKRYVELGWKILEHKCRYYILHQPTITDYEYDLLEKEYDALAGELGLPSTASDMVDFDKSRPACQRVLEKLLAPPPKARRKRQSP